VPDDEKKTENEPKPDTPGPVSTDEIDEEWDVGPSEEPGEKVSALASTAPAEPAKQDEAAKQAEPPGQNASAKPDPSAKQDAPAKGDAAAKQDELDKFRPEAIAARIERLGEETDLDRLASEEEKKLIERKRQKKKGKKGLESAASKRLAKIGEGKVKRPSALADVVAPGADPLLERAARARTWIRDHRQTFGALVTIAALGVGGALGWMYWQDKRNDESSALLAQGFAAEHGHISDTADDDDDDDSKSKQLYPTFKSVGDRRDAALAKYRAVESKYSGTGAAILARLAEAALLLDAGDAKGAMAAYDDVQKSPLALADAEVRGRAIEGRGFCEELLAQSDEAAAPAHRDAAVAAYRELEAVDLKGFKELGKYHEARVLAAKGDKAAAIDLLKEVHRLVSEPGETRPFPYLEFVAEDRLRELDPTALPPKPPPMKPGAGAGAGADTDDPRVQEMLRHLKEQAEQKGHGPAPAPGAPQ
jgi:hypothetical protein